MQNLSKILIVDDQIFNIIALNTILKAKLEKDVDQIIDKATSGQDALDMIKHDVNIINKGKKSLYNLILLDCQMPQMDGYETCQ